MSVETPVEFECWKEDETFETKDVTVFSDGGGYFDVKTEECPHCDETHWVQI